MLTFWPLNRDVLILSCCGSEMRIENGENSVARGNLPEFDASFLAFLIRHLGIVVCAVHQVPGGLAIGGGRDVLKFAVLPCGILCRAVLRRLDFNLFFARARGLHRRDSGGSQAPPLPHGRDAHAPARSASPIWL